MFDPPGLSAVMLLLIFITALWLKNVSAKGRCPIEKNVFPCKCDTRSTGGVDITCDKVSDTSVWNALRAVAETDNTVIYLKIKNCNLQQLSNDSFLNLQVKHLYFHNNSLVFIVDEAFVPLASSIETIHLTHNKLQHIPSGALAPLSLLVTLDFSYNAIETLSSKAFLGLSALLRLNLNNNHIKRIQDQAFEGLADTVQHVNLAHNMITEFPHHAFGILKHVTKIEMQDNQISVISGDLFQNLLKLDSINLNNNLIKTLPSKAFGTTTALHSVHLEANTIDTIADDAFTGLEESLEWLKLGENKLQKIPVTALKHLTNLTELDLHGNNISEVPEDAFKSMSKHLRSLRLGKNNIQDIPVSLTSMHSLEWLYLGDNQLKHVSRETYEPLLHKLMAFDVHNNPLTCDCELRWFREWLTNEATKARNFAEDTRCHEPSDFHGKTLRSISPEWFVCPMYEGTNATSAATEICFSWLFLHTTFSLFLIF